MIQSGVMGPTTYLGWLYEINCIGGDYESFSENQKLAFYEERMTWLEYSAEKRQDGWWVFCPEEHRVGWQPYYELGPFESYFLALKTFLDRYGY